MTINLRPIYLIAVFLVLAATSMATRYAHALDILEPSNNSQNQGDMVLFPGNLGALVSHDKQDPRTGAPGSKAGIHMPGTGYRAGSGWWALVCDAGEDLSDEKKGCRLSGTQLSIAKAKHAVYDSEPVASQLLYWSPLPADLDKVAHEGEKRPKLIMVFKPLRSLANLKLSAGSVTTYVHSGMSQYPATARPGTLEVRLSMGNGRYADVVPRIKKITARKDEGQTSTSAPNIATFELRMGNLRQKLPGFSFSAIEATGYLRPSDYLLWAGDLDGDGKPDLLIRHGDSDIDVALYLSSLAKDGELVGLAGRLQYSDPSSAGC